jgi:hypothetical protein
MKEAVPVYDRAVEALRGSSKKARASLLAQRAMGLHSLGRSQEAAASVRLDGDLLLARAVQFITNVDCPGQFYTTATACSSNH